MYELSANEKVRAEYEMRQKAWRDRISQNEGYYQDGIQKGRQEGLREGRQEGRQEGRLEGRQEGQREVAKRMKARGRPLTEIAEDTGLDAETIREL